MYLFLFRREYSILFRNGSALIMSIGLFALLTVSVKWMMGTYVSAYSLLPLLSLFVMWVLFLASDALYLEDHRSGFFDLITLEKIPMGMLVFIKVCVTWLTFGVILSLCFIAGVCWFIEPPNVIELLMVMLVVTWLYIWAASFANALTLGAERQKALMFLVALPFYVPLFIFQSLLFQGIADGQPLSGYWQMLLGWGLLFTPIAWGGTVMSLKVVGSD